MKTFEIKLRHLPLTGEGLETPVRVPLEPLPLPPGWEQMLLSRWLEAQRKSGKYPEMTIADGMITLACRREDYQLFFHEEVEQKITETNELYTKEQQEAAAQRERDEKGARRRAATEREAERQRLREIAAFNELRRLRAEEAEGMGDFTPEMAAHHH